MDTKLRHVVFGNNVLGAQDWGSVDVRNDFFAAAIESCPVGMSICDATKPSFPIIYVNSAFSGITGYFLHEVMGHRFSFLHGLETDPETIGRIAAALRINQPVDVEIIHYRKDGTPFWCELRVTPMSRDGKIVALIGIHSDITEKRHRHLEDQRRQKLQALGQLSGGVAHEINNLLQPILTYTDLVLRELDGKFPTVAHRLERVLASAAKAGDIVHGILRFARGEVAALSVLDVRAALVEAIDFVRDLLPVTVTVTVTGLDVDVDRRSDRSPPLDGCAPPDPPSESSASETATLGTARINAVGLTQIFTNLLTNASHAMDDRGTIAIVARRQTMASSTATSLGLTPGAYATISITDSGPGMNENIQSRLFEPFFTTKPIGKGTGLGLSVVYGILQNWHGAISVETAPGRGATFTMFIPLIEGASPASPA